MEKEDIKLLNSFFRKRTIKRLQRAMKIADGLREKYLENTQGIAQLKFQHFKLLDFLVDRSMRKCVILYGIYRSTRELFVFHLVSRQFQKIQNICENFYSNYLIVPRNYSAFTHVRALLKPVEGQLYDHEFQECVYRDQKKN